jgi:hypothetical protein
MTNKARKLATTIVFALVLVTSMAAFVAPASAEAPVEHMSRLLYRYIDGHWYIDFVPDFRLDIVMWFVRLGHE